MHQPHSRHQPPPRPSTQSPSAAGSAGPAKRGPPSTADINQTHPDGDQWRALGSLAWPGSRLTSKAGTCDPWHGTAHCLRCGKVLGDRHLLQRATRKRSRWARKARQRGQQDRSQPGPAAEPGKQPGERHSPRGRRDRTPWLVPYLQASWACKAMPPPDPKRGRLRRTWVGQSGPPGPPRRNAALAGRLNLPYGSASWAQAGSQGGAGPGESAARSQCEGHFSKVSPGGLSQRSCPLSSGLGPEPGGMSGALGKSSCLRGSKVPFLELAASLCQGNETGTSLGRAGAVVPRRRDGAGADHRAPANPLKPDHSRALGAGLPKDTRLLAQALSREVDGQQTRRSLPRRTAQGAL